MHQILKAIMSLQGDDRFCVFSRADLEKIHQASIDLLRDVGCRIQSERMLALLGKAGHRTDRGTQVVKFDPEVIEGLIEKHRQPEVRPAYPPQIRARISGLTTRIYDPLTDRVRRAEKTDLERACIIGEVLDEVTDVAPLIVPQDVPAATCAVHKAQAMVTRTRKFCDIEPLNEASLEPIKEILTVVAGSWETAQQRFHPTYNAFINSPLVFTSEPLDVAFRAIELGFGVRYGTPMTIVSATGPVTFPGTLVISNAEALVGLVLADTMHQPWTYGASPVLLDPQTTETAYSGPDRSLLAMTSLDFCRFYGTPPSAHITHSDAVTPDFQNGFERGYALFLQLLGNQTPALSCGQTGPGGNCGCLEQILLDVECLACLRKMVEPVEVSEETLCADLIRKVGIGGQFLAEMHTAENFRDVFWFPTLMKRVSAQEYDQHHRTALRNAVDGVQDILKHHDPHVLSPDQESEVARIVACADAEHAA